MPRNSHSILSLVKWSATFDSPGTLAIFNRPIAIFTTSCTQRNLNSTGAHWRNRLHLSCKAYPSSITRATHIDPLVPHANGAVLVGMHQCLNWPEDRSWRDCSDVVPPSTSWRMGVSFTTHIRRHRLRFHIITQDQPIWLGIGAISPQKTTIENAASAAAGVSASGAWIADKSGHECKN